MGVEPSPAFDAGVAVYAATASADAETVTAEANDDGATVASGQRRGAAGSPEGRLVTQAPGETLVTVTVTAEDRGRRASTGWWRRADARRWRPRSGPSAYAAIEGRAPAEVEFAPGGRIRGAR